MPDAAKKITRKMSVTTLQGFVCLHCGVTTCTYDSSVPVECMNCKHPSPPLKWKDVVTSDVTVETVRLEPKP